MMENVFKYIELLLPQHKCVTLPEFGAFILNKEGHNDVNTLGYDSCYVPSCSVTFNSRLQHDDGVLTSYLQTIEGGSYEKASKELAQIIRKMRANLLINKEIDCGALGKIELKGGSILFEQNKEYIFPQHYGLSPIKLNTINTLSKEIEREVKIVSFKKRFIVAAASTAAILLLTIPTTSVTDNASLNKEQHAGYLKSLAKYEHKPANTVKEESPIEELEISKPHQLPENNRPEAKKIVDKKPVRSYYIIVGGEITENSAKRLLDKFKEEGYTNAQILESPERYRIYIASFDDKHKAEQYLSQFRRNNPKYDSAWLFSQKN